MTVARRGEGRLMFSSRASLIPAMIEAAITSVEENLSLVRCSSSYLVACSRAIASFHLPHECTSAERTGLRVSFMDSLPR